jgi:hypothetical protein
MLEEVKVITDIKAHRVEEQLELVVTYHTITVKDGRLNVILGSKREEHVKLTGPFVQRPAS